MTNRLTIQQRYRISSKANQRGMGLVAAIFVITLMALMATGISRLVVNNQQNNSQQILSLTAQLAAESAVQKSLVEFSNSNLCSEQAQEIVLEAYPACVIYRSCEATAEDQNSQRSIVHRSHCGVGKDQASFQISKTINQSEN